MKEVLTMKKTSLLSLTCPVFDDRVVITWFSCDISQIWEAERLAQLIQDLVRNREYWVREKIVIDFPGDTDPLDKEIFLRVTEALLKAKIG